MRNLETDSLSNQNITTALEVGSYTATATRGVIVRLLCDQSAGNGDYTAYITVQVGGAGSAYRMIPITTANAASGVTALGFVSIPIPVDNTDVLKVYLLGLAGDTTTPDTRVDFYEQDYLRPTVAGRTLDVATTGEAGLDFDNIKDATGAHSLTNITVPVVTSITNPINITSILARGTSPVAGAVNQITLDGSALAVAGSYVHNMIALVGGTGAGQARLITAYSAGRVATVVPNWDVVPANDTVYQVLPIGQSYLNACALDAIDAAALKADAIGEIADGVWDEQIAGHVAAGSTGKTLNDLTPGAAVVLNSEITEIHTT